MILILTFVTVGSMAAIIAIGLLLRAQPSAVIGDTADRIVETLPHSDCGACGYDLCGEFARAVAEGSAPLTGCVPGGPRTAHAIGDILRVEARVFEPTMAVVHCKGGEGITRRRARYDGIGDCVAEARTVNGSRQCTDGCLGLGNCVRACAFDAVRITERGVALINAERCNGCGMCVAACPRGLIEMIPSLHKIFLACAVTEGGSAIRSSCSAGCTSCGLCKAVSLPGSIDMASNLPRLNYDAGDTFVAAANRCPSNCFTDLLRARPKANIDIKCDGCGECPVVCPVNAITGHHGERHSVNRDLCIGCGKCVHVCHVRAIALWGGLGYMRKESVKKPW